MGTRRGAEAVAVRPSRSVDGASGDLYTNRVGLLDAKQRLFFALSSIYLTSLLVADIVAGKYFVFRGLEMSVGTVVFPIVFLLTDIVNEYYGKQGARFLTWSGMAMLVFGFAIIAVARLLPPAPMTPVPQAAFDSVFGLSARLFAASLGAYLVSQFADIYAFHFTKRITRSRFLWIRALGSTVLSQVVDTAFVNFGANAGLRSVGDIAEITLYSYLYKIGVATIMTPILYVAHDIISRRLGIDPAPVDDDLVPLPVRANRS
jgi:uncharacterized integral membrane protein (TIGR00697 family)